MIRIRITWGILSRALTKRLVERPLFFLHSLPSTHPLSLPALRELITDVYLTRNDVRISELESERRPGRPKDKELLKLEEARKSECAEWETGLGGCCLSHTSTHFPFLQWLLISSTRDANMVHL